MDPDNQLPPPQNFLPYGNGQSEAVPGTQGWTRIHPGPSLQPEKMTVQQELRVWGRTGNTTHICHLDLLRVQPRVAGPIGQASVLVGWAHVLPEMVMHLPPLFSVQGKDR